MEREDQQVSVLSNRWPIGHHGLPSGARATLAFLSAVSCWTYDLNGTLTGVPYPGAMIRRSTKRTIPLPRAAHVAATADLCRQYQSERNYPRGASGKRDSAFIDRACDMSPEGEI